MRPPPNVHSNFFSSLKQVEKRLKSEQQSQPQPLKHNNPLLTESSSLSSPIEIHFNQPSNNNNINEEEEKLSTFNDSSEPPQAFLSCSPPLPQTHENPVQSDTQKHQKPNTETNPIDDIEHLVQLLGLSETEKEEEEEKDCGSCHCEGGFYSKIAGVKGPKCEKEVKRLEGWIKHFSNGYGNEIKIEPLRLSLLLLGKAAFVSQGKECGYGGLDFPSAIDDFLMNDPPTKTTT